MKIKILFCFFLCFGFLSLGQQETLSLYHVGDLIQRYRFNPAEYPDSKVNLTVVPGISISSGFYTSFSKALTPISGKKGKYSLNLGSLLDIWTSGNYDKAFRVGIGSNLFYIGLKNKRKDIYYRMFANAKIYADAKPPENLLKVFHEGTVGDNLGKTFSDNISIRSFGYVEIGGGIVKTVIDDAMKIAASLKFLIGTHYFDTGDLYMSLFVDKVTYDNRIQVKNIKVYGISNRENVAKGPASSSYGVALDLAASYDFSDHGYGTPLRLGVSLLDLGTIMYKNVPYLQYKDYELNVDSALILGKVDIEEIKSSLREDIVYDRGAVSFNLPVKLFVTGSYDLGQGLSTISFSSFSRFYTGYTLNTFALGYSHSFWKDRICPSINVVKIDDQDLNLGFAIRANIGPVQLYGATDSILTSLDLSNKQFATSLSLGLNVVIGNRKTYLRCIYCPEVDISGRKGRLRRTN